MKSIQQKANEIIKMFLDNNIPITQQLQILKMAKEKIDFCRNTGAEMQQKRLDFKD